MLLLTLTLHSTFWLLNSGWHLFDIQNKTPTFLRAVRYLLVGNTKEGHVLCFRPHSVGLQEAQRRQTLLTTALSPRAKDHHKNLAGIRQGNKWKQFSEQLQIKVCNALPQEL